MRFPGVLSIANWVARHLVSCRALIAIGMLAALVSGLYLSMRLRLAFEVHRAAEMSAALSGVKIGDPEEAVLPVVNKYDGYRWGPPDKASGRFTYIVGVDPWYFGSMTGHRGRFEHIARHAVGVINANSYLRRAIGLRLWTAGGTIDINEGRVESVSADVIVEGNDEWLGATWTLSPKMPEHVLQRYSAAGQRWPELNRYYVGWTHLHVGGDGTGEGVRVWITPSATDSEGRDGRHIDTSCLTSHSGCWALCNLMPGAARYHKDHPQASWGGVYGEPERTCE